MSDEAKALELAWEVLSKAPQPPDVSADQLAQLALKQARGEYIRVSEFPLPEDELRPFIDHVIQWLWSEPRVQQIREPGPWKIGCYDLIPGADVCAEALAIAQRTQLTPEDIVRLPLDGCWENCTCEWRWRRRRK